MSTVIEDWETETGKQIDAACVTCGQAGFEIINISKGKQDLNSIQRRRLGIPPDCDKIEGKNLNLFCQAKGMYITWMPIKCQMYTDIYAEQEADENFLNK